MEFIIIHQFSLGKLLDRQTFARKGTIRGCQIHIERQADGVPGAILIERASTEGDIDGSFIKQVDDVRVIPVILKLIVSTIENEVDSTICVLRNLFH